MKGGFTLVELLAVIVILAVLALIATPVVLSIIDDAKESAMLRSAEMYLTGVEHAIMKENMNSGGNFRTNECTIIEGSIECDGNPVMAVEVDGEVPSTGSIVFENGKIKEVRLVYSSVTIVKNEEGNLVYNDEESENGSGSDKEEIKILDPGFYDENGTMVYSWSEILNLKVDLINNEGYEWQEPYIVFNNGSLYNGYEVYPGIDYIASPIKKSNHLIISDEVTRITGTNICGVETVYIPSSVTTISLDYWKEVGEEDGWLSGPFKDCRSTLKIYCESDVEQEGWEEGWNAIDSWCTLDCSPEGTFDVVYDVSKEEYSKIIKKSS